MFPAVVDALAFDLFLVNICDLPALLAFVARTLPAAPSRRWVYIALQLIGFLLLLAFDSTGAYEFVAVAFAAMWTLSLAFQEGPFRRRAVTLSLRIVACMLSFGIATAFWLVLTDGAPTSDFHVCRALLVEHALSALLAAVLFWMLLPFADRLTVRLVDYPCMSKSDAELEGG